MKNLLIFSGLLLAGTSLAFADLELSIVPASQNVSPGQTFRVDIDVNSVPDLYDYQFSLAFNPLVLAADKVTEGALFANTGNSFFSPGTIDNSGGTIQLVADTLFSAGPGVAGPGTLAVVQFTAVGAGTSSLDFVPADLILQDSQGNVLDVTAGSANVSSVVSTPEPATLFLVQAGIVLLIFRAYSRPRRFHSS